MAERSGGPSVAFQPPARLRRARLATFVFFGLNGFVLAMWVVHIPIVEHRTRISHSGLGVLLLLLGLGALAGMRLCGPLADCYGPRIVMVCAVPLLGLALIGRGAALRSCVGPSSAGSRRAKSSD